MYLYLLTNTAREPQKLYVGITSRPVNRRLLEHFNTASKKTTLIARALHKYGRDAFTLTVLGQAESWEDLCAMEQAAITHYNTFVPNGYNLTRGGDGTIGWKHSPEAIERTRQANLGRVRDQAFRDAVGARMRGVPKSPEQRAKMGEWQRGANNSQYGKTPTHLPKMLEALAKIREENGDPRKGRPISDEHKANLSHALKGRAYTEAERVAHQATWDAMQGRVVSEDTKAKISAKTREQFARQGNPMQGRKHSAETKEKIAAAHRGKPAHNKGKKYGPLSDETKAKLSEALQGHPAWNKGIPWREIVGGKEHPKARAVEYNGVVYASVMECHAKTGLARNTIKNHIKQGKARYMANTILTPAMLGTLGEPPMADAPAVNPADVFPRYGFSATEPGTPFVDSATGQPVCNSRLFASKAELDAAGGTAVWSLTPDAAAKAKAPAPRTPVADDDEEAPARRSHR